VYESSSLWFGRGREEHARFHWECKLKYRSFALLGEFGDEDDAIYEFVQAETRLMEKRRLSQVAERILLTDLLVHVDNLRTESMIIYFIGAICRGHVYIIVCEA